MNCFLLQKCIWKVRNKYGLIMSSSDPVGSTFLEINFYELVATSPSNWLIPSDLLNFFVVVVKPTY